MEQSSSGSTNSDPRKINNSDSDREARSADAYEAPYQRMVADRLLAALASGNLEHLAQARRAFIKQPAANRKRELRPSSSNTATPLDGTIAPSKHAPTPTDLAASLERQSAPHTTEEFLPAAELRQIEDELRQAEAELQRRRVEVAAAKRNVEDEAKRLAFEESRRELEAKARQQAEEEEQRLAVLQTLRDQAEVATRERGYQQCELNASIQALKIAEQEASQQIAEAEVCIHQSEDECRRLHFEAQERAERVLWLNEEIEDLRKAETEQITLVQATEARLLAQVEAKHVAAADAQRRAQKLADDERRLSEELGAVRADEAQQQERLSRLTDDLAHLKITQQAAAKNVAEATAQEQQLKSAINEHHANEQQLRQSIAAAEERLREAEQAYLAAQIEAELRSEHEQQQLSEFASLRTELDTAAQRRAEKIQALNTEIGKLRDEEAELVKLVAETESRLHLQEEKEQKLLQELEGVHRTEKETLARIETLKERISQMGEKAQERVDQEQQLTLTLGVLHEQQEEQIKRLDEIQSHLADQVRACYLTEAESQELAEKAELVNIEHESIVKNKENHAKSVAEAETRLRTLTELKHGVQINSQHSTEKEQQLAAEIDALRLAEEEQIKRVQLVKGRLNEHEEARHSAKTRVKELTEREQQLLTEIEDLRRRETEQLNRVKEAEARIPGHEEAVRQAEAQAQRKADEETERLKQLELICIKAQTEATQRAEHEKQLRHELESLQRPEVESEPFELLDTKAIVRSNAQTVTELTAVVDSTPEPRLTIDLGETDPQATLAQEIVAADLAADVIGLEPITARDAPDHFQSQAIPGDISQWLQSADSSQRAAALADLADAGGSDAFGLITKCFDDPSIEVRNAAARALHSWQPDLAASFTRALREASPERRRKIGAAIAGSGLAANAINSLSGAGRDRAYDAFSILFLMAKAGEVQPLMQAIAKHHDLEVRLTAVKLIGLSKQQRVLPGLRNMASCDQLPPEVHTAVMEAIYLLNNQTGEVG